MSEAPLISTSAQVAHSLHSLPGVYAILLGSGVSRAASIPTGWDITKDMILRVAKLRSERCGSDPEGWYTKKFGEPPSYSKLLKELAPTPAARQALINSYIEPTESDRAQGLKQPTAAHRAVAQLVASGHIRVILTTNFDRLMERALQDVGIDPSVVSSLDGIVGAVPLVHSRCTIVKLHGDYRDTRSLNTSDELTAYPKKWKDYLSRILDEFGLIICGWSAQWDGALADAIKRTPSRRYQCFWSTLHDLAGAAADLATHRQAMVVKVESADAFFQDIADRVEALRSYGPVSDRQAEQVQALVKQYISEERYEVRLVDLMQAEARNAALAGIEAIDASNAEDGGNLSKLVARLDASVKQLRAIEAIGVTQGRKVPPRTWVRPLQAIHNIWVAGNGQQQQVNGFIWLPLTELFYCVGVLALAEERFDIVRTLFDAQFERPSGHENGALDLLPATLCGGVSKAQWQQLNGMDRHHLPLNDYLFSLLESDAVEVGLTKAEWALSFDRFEVLVALAHGYRRLKDSSDRFWGPPGRYAWMANYRSLDNVVGWFDQDEVAQKLIDAGLFGGTKTGYLSTCEAFRKWLPELAKYFW